VTKLVVGGDECLNWKELSLTETLIDRNVSMTGGWFGRLGNRITTVSHMLKYAEDSSCCVDIPLDMISGWNPSHCRWCYVKKNSSNVSLALNTCESQVAKEWYFNTTTTESPPLLHPPEWSLPACQVELLQKYFNINHTHALGKECSSTEHVALHVRSGDVTDGGSWLEDGNYVPEPVHAMYGLFPTAYYMSVIREVRSRRGDAVKFFVFCETLTNPTCEFFKTLSLMDGKMFMRVNQTLIDDMRLMLCASETAASRGTFHRVFGLSAVGQVQHSFSYTPVPAVSCGSASVEGFSKVWHWMTSANEASKFQNITKHWKNTGFQRHNVNLARTMSHTQLFACENP